MDHNNFPYKNTADACCFVLLTAMGRPELSTPRFNPQQTMKVTLQLIGTFI
jgi:hypothetical protein